MATFKLTDEAQSEGFSGGTVHAGYNGFMLDIGQALESGGGFIVTDDETLAGALRQYPALEVVADESQVPQSTSKVSGPETTTQGTAINMPYIGQSGSTDTEIPAEHADTASVSEELAAGESVSGNPPAAPAKFDPPVPSDTSKSTSPSSSSNVVDLSTQKK